MIPDFTRDQLAGLDLSGGGPLLICDVDEVVVHFTRAFEDYLAADGMFLDAASFAINGNVRRRDNNEAVTSDTVARLIDGFFVDCTEHLHPLDGAVESLGQLGSQATVVMLTNLPHHARDKRVANLRRLGLPYPVVTNSGPKGPAIRHLAATTGAPVVFVDDSPGFIASCRDHAPQVHLVHFLHDQRFARHLEPFPYVSLTTNSWEEALPHISAIFGP